MMGDELALCRNIPKSNAKHSAGGSASNRARVEVTMVDVAPQGSGGTSGERERYSHGYDPIVVAHFARRTVTTEGAFFVPHLRSGMRLLDCGCGPGTLTVGLER